MISTTYTDISSACGLAYYNGYIYAGSYNNRTIQKINLQDSSDKSNYYTGIDASYSLNYMRVYDNYLYCSLIHNTIDTSGKIVKFNLSNPTPTPIEYINNLHNPQSFVLDYDYIYITLATEIRRHVRDNSSYDVLIDSSNPIIRSPRGIEFDGFKLYFCNWDISGVYSYDLTDETNNQIATLPNINNNGLTLYGNNLFMSSNLDKKIYKIDINTYAITEIETLSDAPNNILLVNNDMFISSKSSNKILTRPVSTKFKNMFNLNFSEPNNFIYMLNDSSNINNNWEEVGLQTGKITIDGNSKTINIVNLITETLFFGGGKSNINRLEIKNLTIKSNTNIKCGLLRAHGYAKMNNCHLELVGNILNYGGGFAYNDYNNNPDYDLITDIQIVNSSAFIIGKIGDYAGGLIGFFITGCRASIIDSFSVVLDNDPESEPKTLLQQAGAFVGGSVGQTYGVDISNSYCIFNGSMHHSSGIIGGKYFGSNSNISINNFYAVTNITSVVAPTNISDNAHYPYYLSYYGNGSDDTSIFSSINNTNVNFLNFGLDINRMYANETYYNTTLENTTKHTNFATFDLSANTESARVGTKTYYLNHKNSSIINSYKLYSPTNNIKYEILFGDNNQMLQIRDLSFSGPINKTDNSPKFNLYPTSITVDPSTSLFYYSSNPAIADVSGANGTVTIYTAGDVSLTVYAKCDEPNLYSYVEAMQRLIITDASEFRLKTLKSRKYRINSKNLITVLLFERQDIEELYTVNIDKIQGKIYARVKNNKLFIIPKTTKKATITYTVIGLTTEYRETKNITIYGKSNLISYYILRKQQFFPYK